MSFDLKIDNNNLKINIDGSIQVVRDNEKLSQDVAKAILTPIGSNKFYTWYGNTIYVDIIGQNLPNNIVEIETERSIQYTLSQLISLQNTQSRTQYVSAGEMIAAIKDISVLRSNTDPRQFEIYVSILTRKLNKVEETFTLII